MRATVFMSSAQKELQAERRAIKDYVHGDPLLRRFFDVFLFEDLPASDRRADEAYLGEVDRCDIYVGLFGDEYSAPTEREFDRATATGKLRLIFVKGADDKARHPKMRALVRKAGGQLLRRRFGGISDLTDILCTSLVAALEPRDLEREDLELVTLSELADAKTLGLVRIDLETVNDELILSLRRHPELLHEIDPRRFEELVAELMRDRGWEVRLTPRSRDGGRDILAFFKNPVGTMLTLVECKRWRPDRHVGVEIVRGLYGVVSAENASGGMIATTSFFTTPAREFQQSVPHRLSLRDRDALLEWIRSYKQRGRSS